MTIFSFKQFCNSASPSPTGHLLDGGLLFSGAGLKPEVVEVNNTQGSYKTTKELKLLPITGHKYANESMAIVNIFDDQFPDWKYISVAKTSKLLLKLAPILAFYDLFRLVLSFDFPTNV